MTHRIRSIPMIFDYNQFATDIRAWCQAHDFHYSDVDRAAGIGSGSTSKFARAEARNPQMDTWLSICNVCDLDPRQYFVLE